MSSSEMILTDEIRKSYDHELNRKSSLEMKASTLFGLAAIVTAIQGITINYLLSQSTYILESMIVVGGSLLGVAFLISSLWYLLKVINLILYQHPYEKDPNKSPEVLKDRDTILINYRKSIFHTSVKNDESAIALMKGRVLLFIGVIISIIPLFIFSGIRLGFNLVFIIPFAVVAYLIYLYIIKKNEKIMDEYDPEEAVRYKKKCKETYLKNYEEKCGQCRKTKFINGCIVYLCLDCGLWLCPKCLREHSKYPNKIWLDYVIKNGIPVPLK